MSTGEFLLFLVLVPPAAIIAGIVGRKTQRSLWMLNRPYSERVADLKPYKKAA